MKLYLVPSHAAYVLTSLKITDNSVSGVTSPKSKFADASHCSQPIQQLFNDNSNLVYYPTGVTGEQNLQSDFKAASGNVTNFLCSTTPLPSSITYSDGKLDIVSDSPAFANLHGVIMQYQGDNNIVVLDTASGNAVWASGHTINGGCGSPSLCRLAFTADGNLLTYYNGKPQFSTGTEGRGTSMVCMNESPWIQIFDKSGTVIWDTTKSL